MKRERINVLAIEDDPGDAEILRRALERVPGSACEFTHVENAKDAPRIIADAQADLLLIDYVLGPCTGLDLLHQIRGAGDVRPIIIMTGQGDERIAAEVLRAGADDYLVKADINPGTLRRAIDNAAAQHDRRRVEVENTRLLRELQEQNARMEQTNRRLAELYATAHEFVDNVSHEFRTPLTVIKEFSAIMLDGLAGEPTADQKKYLAIVLNRVDDLATMIDDMLDISKLEAGLLFVWRRESRVSEIVERARVLLERKALAAGVRLAFDTGEDVPPVYCDPEKAERTLINLVVNAIKFSNPDSEVRVWTRFEPERSQVRLGVTDQGPGISPANLKVIFDRFKQVGGNPRAGTKGFGLGLNIARELVQLNFGDIEVESEPGNGSAFSFTVPCADPMPLIGRYLDRIAASPGEADFVTAIHASIEPGLAPEQLRETEHFIQHQLRRSDLLFRTPVNGWLLLIPSPLRRHNDPVVKRMDQAWRDANRNRPTDPLPGIHYRALGTWDVRRQRAEFLRHACEQLKQPEPHYV